MELGNNEFVGEEAEASHGEALLNQPVTYDVQSGRILRARTEETCKPWISEDGCYWKGDHFNLDAYDPAESYSPRGRTYRLCSNPNQLLENPFDLDNLRFLDPAEVKSKLSELEMLAERRSGKDLVAMIGMGGTIAMRPGVSDVLEPALDTSYLLDYAGNGLKERFEAVGMEFPTPMDSSQEEIDYIGDIVIAMSWLWQHASELLRESFSGFLITHGTDTMADAGCYLTMMLGPECPFTVGMLGAQRSIDPEGNNYSDVSANVVNSFRTLSLLKRDGKVSVFVYAGGTSGCAYDPVGVMKVNDKTPDYIKSPVHSPILDAQHFAADGVHLPFRDSYAKISHQNEPIGEDRFWPVILRGYRKDYSVEPRMGERPHLHYRNIMESPPNEIAAVVLTTFGSFTANNKMRDALLLAASSTDRLFFALSPFPDGDTDESRYAPAEALKKHAVHILPMALSAKITLGWHLYGNDKAKLREFIVDRNYVGEQIPLYWNRHLVQCENNVLLGTPPELFKHC